MMNCIDNSNQCAPMTSHPINKRTTNTLKLHVTKWNFLFLTKTDEGVNHESNYSEGNRIDLKKEKINKINN